MHCSVAHIEALGKPRRLGPVAASSYEYIYDYSSSQCCVFKIVLSNSMRRFHRCVIVLICVPCAPCSSDREIWRIRWVHPVCKLINQNLNWTYAIAPWYYRHPLARRALSSLVSPQPYSQSRRSNLWCSPPPGWSWPLCRPWSLKEGRRWILSS